MIKNHAYMPLLAFLANFDLKERVNKPLCAWLEFIGNSEWRLEKAVAPHSSTLAWKNPMDGGAGGLQSMGLLRV